MTVRGQPRDPSREVDVKRVIALRHGNVPALYLTRKERRCQVALYVLNLSAVSPVEKTWKNRSSSSQRVTEQSAIGQSKLALTLIDPAESHTLGIYSQDEKMPLPSPESRES